MDAGADLVIGHHAHRIQAFEMYEGRWIVYGLGNCVFPEVHPPVDTAEQGYPMGGITKPWHEWNRRSLGTPR